MSFLRGIRVRLLLVALSLLALPWLAAQFIARMETSLRASQEQAIGATSRAIAVALSDRPGLFGVPGAQADPEEEERRRIVALFAAADTDAAASLGAAYVPSEQVERLLAVAGRRGTRLWVVDTRSRVRGLWGRLARDDVEPRAGGWLKPIASLVVPTPRVAVGDESRPVREQINGALIGISRSPNWRGTVDRDVAILSAAQPVFNGDDIVGALVVEETTASIQLLKQSALENLLGVTLAVVGGAFLVLLAYAGRLAARIRRLHREAEDAIDSQGRVRGTVTPSDAGDEIGDLSRTMAAVIERLRGYNAYLEAMAGRLSHELRTPVAVVRSSLDNLREQPLPEEARKYVERAGDGVGRLARLISRLSESTRLERLLESAERVDLAQVVAGCVEGYRSAYAPRAFTLARPEGAAMIDGVPDAIAQLLDKLVENANDFAPPGTPIRLALQARGRGHVLAVENDGPPLPESARAQLFDSMVTLREPRAPSAADDAAHLGLGLYIVRLVAEFHGGRVRAANLPGGAGVRFEVELP
jgi:two-component system sensor histidine kinase ChvG